MTTDGINDPTSPQAAANRGLSRAQREVLCEELGLRMRDIADCSIEFGSGSMTLIKWTGVRRLNAPDTADLLRKIADAEAGS